MVSRGCSGGLRTKKAGVTVHYVCEVDQVPIGEFENGMPVGDGLVLKTIANC